MCHHCGSYSLCCTVLHNLQITFILSSKKTTSAKALKKTKQNKDGLQTKGTAYKYSVTKCWLLQLKYRVLLLSTSPTQLLLVCSQSPAASFQLKQPCRPGQQYTTPHKNEASHSEHQAHCPALTPPLTRPLHPACVHMSSFR